MSRYFTEKAPIVHDLSTIQDIKKAAIIHKESRKKWKNKKFLKQKKSENDPFPGSAPISKDKLKRHERKGESVNLKRIKLPKNKKQIKQKEELYKLSHEIAARSELLLPEQSGFIEPENELEDTAEVTQTQIKDAVDITSAAKQFNLQLELGPYRVKFLRNGRHLLLGGRLGHIASLDFSTKHLQCEMNTLESVHDITWLHNETMFAAAQKDWTYIYDNRGIELHCLKGLYRVLKMEFLPYHFLLATASENGFLSWLDVSLGKMVAQFFSKMGRIDKLCQNPYNAILCAGHSKGFVSMWTPNMKEPVAKMLCHGTPIRALTIDQRGLYMATAAVDKSMKIWDIRNFKCLQSYRLNCAASNLAFSHRNLLAVSTGDIVDIYKDQCTKAVDGVYLRHRLPSDIENLEFCPYEDVLGVGHRRGFTSMLVPGAGEPNPDAFEANPFQTQSQRREVEVKQLLEKIQPELITLDPGQLGQVDEMTLEEKIQIRTKVLFVKPPKIELKKNKGLGSAKQFHVKRQLTDETRRRFIKETAEEKLKVMEEVLGSQETEDVVKVYDPLSRFKKQKK
ncbi:WD repeat-containing protein 46-like isoform X2 [Artemia franciscana]